jgi:predicted DNA-binding transcriptional regulator AlpA
MTTTQTTELLTPEQVAEMLQVHPGTLENWRVRGEGPAFVKLGNRRRSPVRYPRKDVEDWIYADMKRDGKGKRP